MQHAINPKIDCVFKALLGSEAHKDLLIHFLNVMVYADSDIEIISVELLNPYNEKEFISDKLSIVDVKAKDQEGRTYQIEIQIAVYHNLPARMLYTWCSLYNQQLRGGDDYNLLNPTHAIWLVDGQVFQDKHYYRQFKMQDEYHQGLINHGGIIVVELPKFSDSINNDKERWIEFFNQAETFTDLTNLPKWMNTPEMEQAMTVLKGFSEKEIAYHQYQAREDYLREQATIKADFLKIREKAQEEKRIAQEEKRIAQEEKRIAQQGEQAAITREKVALAEIEQLRRQLSKK